MAIDLPPVLPPVQADQATIQAASRAAAIVGRAGQIEIRVVGNKHLSNDRVQRVIAEAEKPSEVVTRLLSAYYTAGHLLMDLKYFRRGNVATVVVSQKTLSEVQGPQQARQHFLNLEGDTDLTVAEFDRSRVMADVQARRVGIDYSISYKATGDNAVAMVLTPKPVEDHDTTDLIVELNNKGSRYLGRYFGSVGLQHDFNTGGRLNVAFQNAYADWGESVDGENLEQWSLSFNQPTAFGLYGAELTYMEYERSPLSQRFVAQENCILPDGSTIPIPVLNNLLGLVTGGINAIPGACSQSTVLVSSTESVDADVLRAALTGEQVLYSKPGNRLSFTQRLEYVDSYLGQDSLAEPLQDERYGALDLGLKYTLRSREKGKSGLSARINLKGGFAGEGTLDSSDSNTLVAGARESEFLRLRPEALYQHRLFGKTVASVSAKAQFADARLPQQQQFVLGGMNSLSAYLPGVLAGDEGYFVKADVSTKWKLGRTEWKPSLFVEHGATSYVDTGTVLDDDQTLTDAGVRLDVSLGKTLKSELVAAVPLEDDVISNERLELLEADFFWRVRLEL